MFLRKRLDSPEEINLYEMSYPVLWEKLEKIHFKMPSAVTFTKHAKHLALTCTTQWVNSADGKLMMFFLFFLENRIWHFVQIVSLGDNLHEVSNPISRKNKKKYFKMSSAEYFTQHAKC